jgi:hypothetical protein
VVLQADGGVGQGFAVLFVQDRPGNGIGHLGIGADRDKSDTEKQEDCPFAHRVFSVRRTIADLVTSISFDQEIIIILEFEIALVVNVMILASRSCDVDRGKQGEIEIVLDQPVLQDFCFSAWVQLAKDLVILSETVVRVPDEVLAVSIDLVVVGVPAIVTAEFLVTPAF